MSHFPVLDKNPATKEIRINQRLAEASVAEKAGDLELALRNIDSILFEIDFENYEATMRRFELLASLGETSVLQDHLAFLVSDSKYHDFFRALNGLYWLGRVELQSSILLGEFKNKSSEVISNLEQAVAISLHQILNPLLAESYYLLIHSMIWAKRLDKDILEKIEEAIKNVRDSKKPMFYRVKGEYFYLTNRKIDYQQVVLELAEKYPKSSDLVFLTLHIFDKTPKKRTQLYHYTNLIAIEGIINNEEFHASRIDMMNDLSECSYFANNWLDEAIKILSKKQNAISKTLMDDLAFIQPYLQKTFDSNCSCRTHNLYVISLCKKKDYWPMWNIYSSGRHGYCLEFDFNECNEYLKYASLYTSLHWRTGEVQYGFSSMKNYISSLLKEYQGWLDKIKPETRRHLLSEVFMILSAFFKDKCFSTEEEYRVIFIPSEKMLIMEPPGKGRSPEIKEKFKHSEGRLKAYLPIPFTKRIGKLLSTIRISPLNERYEERKSGIEDYLEHKKLDRIKVAKSIIKIRR